MLSEKCKNCNASLYGIYCSACGQKNIQGRYDWVTLWEELANKLFGVEKGGLYTIIRLATVAGIVGREYVQGRRRSYTPPVSYFVFALAAYILVMQYTDVVDSAGGGILDGFNESLVQKKPAASQNAPVLSESSREWLKGVISDKSSLLSYVRILNIMVLPFSAIGWYILMRSRAYSWLETLMGILFLHGHILLCDAIIHIPSIFIVDANLFVISTAFSFLFSWVYTIWFVKGFYQEGLKKSILIAVVGEVFSMAAMLAISFLIIVAIVLGLLMMERI